MKNIYLIVALSGAGKTTITELLESKYGLTSIQSYTTRPPRFEGETGHTFVSDEEFDRLTDIVAYTEFADYKYCATTNQVEENDLYVIDPKGIDYFKEQYKGDKQVKIIYIESNVSTRFERMVSREEQNDTSHSEAVDIALNRIVNDVTEFYDYVHNNVKVDCKVRNNAQDNIDSVVNKVYTYICAENGDIDTEGGDLVNE